MNNKTFLEEFINYSNQIFPAIDSSIRHSIKDALKQFDINKFSWFSTDDLGGLCQGDILNKIPFTFQEENGKFYAFPTKAMVISNSCDIENDKDILLAPLIPYLDTDEFNENQKQDLLNNKYNGKMCLSYSSVGNYYIDFSRIQSFNKNLIVNLIDSNKIKLEHSLSQFGWYFLLTKMTIHFMRIEDHELFSTRLKGA